MDANISKLIHQLSTAAQWDIYTIREACVELLTDVNDHTLAAKVQTLINAHEQEEDLGEHDDVTCDDCGCQLTYAARTKCTPCSLDAPEL